MIDQVVIQLDKLEFTEQPYGHIVGAANSRPRSKMFRIRIGLRRIRKIMPPDGY